MNSVYKENFIRAGALAKQVRSFGESLIKEGASYQEIIRSITKKIFSLGAIPAFPPQIALNEVAAHFLLKPGEDIIFSKEVVKLDVGVCYEGAIGDCAVTVDLSKKYERLIQAVEEALLKAEISVKVGQNIREIGKIIDETISSYGFRSIKNLSGHGLGLFKVHTPPSIPNYDDRSKAVIRPGMTFAIEPFATDGVGFIDERGDPMIFSYKANRSIKTEPARHILAKMRDFQGLPCAFHDFLDLGLSYDELKLAFIELIELDAIHAYGPLIEEEGGMVAQAENSVLVDEKGNILITTR